MEQDILDRLSYGLYILTAQRDGKDNGCIIDTVVQIASQPQTISISVCKTSYTCEMIEYTRKFTISVMSENAHLDLYKRFGYLSGRDVDKFEDFESCIRVANGTLAVTEGTNAYFAVNVTQQVDLGSHIMYIGIPTDGEILNDDATATYLYYAEHVKCN